MRGIITDGTYCYYMDPTDGHLVTNAVLAVGESMLQIDELGHVQIL